MFAFGSQEEFVSQGHFFTTGLRKLQISSGYVTFFFF